MGRRWYGSLYLICDDCEYVKIGWTSRCVRSRFKEIQSGNPRELFLIAEVSGASTTDEHDLMRCFAHRRVRGEWFKPDADMWRFLEEAFCFDASYWGIRVDCLPNGLEE
jgi:hypothetical protein